MDNRFAIKNLYKEGNVLRGDGIEPGRFYVVFPYGIGDTWYACSFMDAYKNQYIKGKRVCYLVKKSHEMLVRLFMKDDDEIVVSSDIVDGFEQFSVEKEIWHLDNYLYAHFKKDINQMIFPEYYEIGTNMIDKYRKIVLGLDDSATRMIPELPVAADELITKYAINRKSVVLMPYARSVPLLPIEFWELIAQFLLDSGYNVLTNIGPGEVPIRNTNAMSESVIDTIGLCKKSLAVISIRSGICDILAATDTLMFIINTEQHYYRYWNLSELSDGGRIADLLCDTQDKLGETAGIIAKCFV